MGSATCAKGALVTYRGPTAAGREVELRLNLAATMVNVADAWERLTEAYSWIEPTSLEILIREEAELRALRPAQAGDCARPQP
jgi:hypothetical protein